MRIRTQFILTLSLFGIILAAISVSALITNQRVNTYHEQESIADSVAQGASELSYLANDYVIYRESQQLERWQTRYASFSNDVFRLNVTGPEEESLINNIKANALRLKDVFDSVAATAEVESGTLNLELLRVSWSRITIQSQALISDATRLSHMVDTQVDMSQSTNTVIVVALVCIFIGYLVFNFLWAQRRVLKSVAELQAGTAVVGSGNLDFQIEEKRNDEIGDLAHAFNRMTADLKTVTASKSDLEREVEERKKAQDALRQNEHRLQSLFSSMIEGVCEHEIIYDPSGKAVDYIIVSTNPAYEKITGFSNRRVLGSRASELYGSNEPPYLEEYARVAETGEPLYFETYYAPMEKHFSISVFSPGRGKFVTVFSDITERKKAEAEIKRSNAELEASNRELETFAYSVSHDLMAPLRSMEGFSDALIEDYADKLDDQGRQYLRYVQESSDLMGRLIDDLLKLSRVTRSDMSYEVVNLSELAEDILVELARIEPRNGMDLNVAPNITAFGDRNLLRLVLENLLGNAWKFSGKTKSPRIEVGVSERDGVTAYYVRDNGVGFDMTYADKLFKPFQRLHKNTEFAGTGIGLATAQRIINRHGGRIWAESKKGEGATFYFTLG